MSAELLAGDDLGTALMVAAEMIERQVADLAREFCAKCRRHPEAFEIALEMAIDYLKKPIAPAILADAVVEAFEKAVREEWGVLLLHPSKMLTP